MEWSHLKDIFVGFNNIGRFSPRVKTKLPNDFLASNILLGTSFSVRVSIVTIPLNVVKNAMCTVWVYQSSGSRTEPRRTSWQQTGMKARPVGGMLPETSLALQLLLLTSAGKLNQCALLLLFSNFVYANRIVYAIMVVRTCA